MIKWESYGNDRGMFSGSCPKNIIMPNMSNIISGFVNTAMFYRNRTNLRKLVVGKLVSAGIFCGGSGEGRSPNLVHLEVGEDTAISLGFMQYDEPSNAISKLKIDLIEDPSICVNNLEQFLYNFRTYIINRLHDYKGGSKHTITLRKVVYNAVLGLDTEGYANTFHMPDEPNVDYVTSLNQKLTDINWGLAYV